MSLKYFTNDIGKYLKNFEIFKKSSASDSIILTANPTDLLDSDINKRLFIKIFINNSINTNLIYESKIYNYIEENRKNIKDINLNDYFITSPLIFKISGQNLFNFFENQRYSIHNFDLLYTAYKPIYSLINRPGIEMIGICSLNYGSKTMGKLYNELFMSSLSKEKEIKQLLVQIIYAIHIMNNVLNIYHNDLHFDNIIVEELDRERDFIYYFKDSQIIMKNKYIVRFYDFDRAYCPNIGPNNFLDVQGLCNLVGSCNTKSYIDIHHIIVSLIFFNKNYYTKPFINKITENLANYNKGNAVANILFLESKKNAMQQTNKFWGSYCDSKVFRGVVAPTCSKITEDHTFFEPELTFKRILDGLNPIIIKSDNKLININNLIKQNSKLINENFNKFLLLKQQIQPIQRPIKPIQPIQRPIQPIKPIQPIQPIPKPIQRQNTNQIKLKLDNLIKDELRIKKDIDRLKASINLKQETLNYVQKQIMDQEQKLRENIFGQKYLKYKTKYIELKNLI